MSSYTADMVSDNAADKVAMLLSTDWFQPYWPVIGLNVTLESMSCIQKGCRDIVSSMVGVAEEYWLISFSEERVRATREAVLALAGRCGLDAASAERLNDLCRERPQREEREKTAWLFRMVLAELAGDNSLTPEVRLVLENADGTFQFDDKFHAQSGWDRRIRDLTPDLPTFLSDWISVGVLAEAALDHILTSLNTEQQQLLRARFKVAAVRLTGLNEAALPDSW
ncbi:MAG TPA: hypothetical protein VF532_10265 [Candidatus Angelobacter sp.]